LAKSEPDGYTIALGYYRPLRSDVALQDAAYDPRKDFRADRPDGNAPNSLVVHPSFPAKTVAELIAYAKANPGKVNFGSAGAGTVSQYHRRIFRRFRRHQAGPTFPTRHRPGADRSVGRAYPMAFAPIPRVHPSVTAGLLRRRWR